MLEMLPYELMNIFEMFANEKKKKNLKLFSKKLTGTSNERMEQKKTLKRK